MKTNITTFALMAIITSSAFAALKAPMPEFKNEKQLAEWRAGRASQATNQGYAKEEPAFYTGKPYLASASSYAFKYRSYNPEMARWTSEDPSGFPDGANQSSYAANPNFEFDPDGLATQTFNVSYTSRDSGIMNANANAYVTYELTSDKKSVLSKSVAWGTLLGDPVSDDGSGNSAGNKESIAPSAEAFLTAVDTDAHGRFVYINVYFASTFIPIGLSNPTVRLVQESNGGKIYLE